MVKVYKINNTSFTFDERGFLKGIQWNGQTFMSRGRGLFDLAQPIKYDYENIRLEPDKATFFYDGTSLTVDYERLRPDFEVPALPELDGGVSARLRLEALPDGRSVSMKLSVYNNAQAPVRQVMFPYFKGLDAVSSEKETRFTTLGFSYRPFQELNDYPGRRNFHFTDCPVIAGKVFHSGGYLRTDDMIGRYYDYGSLKGGFSLYHRHWGFGPDLQSDVVEADMYMRMGDDVFMRLIQRERLLWLGGIHYVNLKKGECYESKEYIFTPHEGGWENGIGPYEDWVSENKKRPVSPPEAIRDGLGFRTIWMKEQYPCDPDSVVWKYSDLPAVGKDMLEHSLNEMVIWGTNTGKLPLAEDCYIKELGGFREYKEGIRKLKEMGVNPVPFVSFVSIYGHTVDRYGLKLDGPKSGWAQNLKAIPSFRTPYMEKCRSKKINQNNPLWQKDVANALAFLRDELGAPSVCWDQYIADDTPGGVRDLIQQYREETAEKYPDATFSGESCYLYEADINVMDYTWDWAYTNFGSPRDSRAYARVVRTTRLNINIDDNPLDVKRCFMDNIFMNLMPSKPNGVNGSALISDYPELSAALKRAANLRTRYLRFFRDGDMAGDCVLGQEAENAYVTGYRMPEETLVLVWCKSAGQVSLKLPSLKGWRMEETTDFDSESPVNAVWKQGELSLEMEKDALVLVRFQL